MIPKPLSKDAMKARDAVEILTGKKVICRWCDGTGIGAYHDKEIPGLKGKVFKVKSRCRACGGERIVERSIEEE